MANETLHTEAPTQPQIQIDVEQLRANFTAAAKHGSNPQIGDFLERAPADAKELLLRELLAIEFACRLERREDFSAEEYRRRFPQFGLLVQQLYDQHVKFRELKGYEDLQLLGAGGMGVVYKARQIGLNRTVAVKFLADHCLKNEKMIARFQQEKQSIGQLSHDNIVQAYDAGEEGGRQFLVMEFVDGICVTDLIKRTGTLPLADACEIGRQVCEGLEYARKKGVVHRDIKPSNLMLTREGTVKILDFGLARVKLDRAGDSAEGDGGLTTDGTAMGTLDYMAPEQFEDAKNVDHRADIYSLGCTLFHLLAGRAPFGVPKYASELSKKKGHTMDPTPRVDEVRPDVPPEVAEIIARMMAKHRTERFAAAGEVADALAPYSIHANLVEYLDPGATVADRRGGGSSGTLKAALLETQKQSKPPAVADTRGRFAAATAWLRARPWQTAAIAAVAAGAVGLTLFLLRGGNRGADEAQQNHAAQTPSIVTPPNPATPPIVLEQALATLPGLDGNHDDSNWWFNEMPWLIPQARQHLAAWARDRAKVHDNQPNQPYARLSASINDSSATNELKKWLKLYTQSGCPDDPPDDKANTLIAELANDLIVKHSDTLSNQSRRLESVRDRLWGMAGMPLPFAPEPALVERAAEKLSAADLHLLAVVLHKQATLLSKDSRSDLFLAADQAYQKAIKKYWSDKDHQLELLCECDRAELLCSLGVDAQVAEGGILFAKVGHDPEASPILSAYALSRCGDAYGQVDSDDTDAAFADAQEVAKKFLPFNHPLTAFVKERDGWERLNKLDFRTAANLFNDAATIRQSIGQENTEAWLHDLHAAAMAQQYKAIFSPPDEMSDQERQDCLNAAHDEFTKVIAAVWKQLKSNDQDMTQQQWLNRCERLRNSLDRDADGFLFGRHDYGQAAAGYRKCLAYLEEHQSAQDASAASAEATQYKLAIAVACADPFDAQTAGDELQKANARFDGFLEGERNSMVFLKAVANSMYGWRNWAAAPNDDVRKTIVRELAVAYGKRFPSRETPRPPRLLRDERLPVDLLVKITAEKPNTLENDAWAQARQSAVSERAP